MHASTFALTSVVGNYLSGTGGKQWPLPAPTLEALREVWLIDWTGWIYSGTGRKKPGTLCADEGDA